MLFKPNKIYICKTSPYEGYWFVSDGVRFAPLNLQLELTCSIQFNGEYVFDLVDGVPRKFIFREYSPADEPTSYDPEIWGKIKAGRYKTETGFAALYAFKSMEGFGSYANKFKCDGKIHYPFRAGEYCCDKNAFFVPPHGETLRFTHITRPFIPQIDDPQGLIQFPKTEW